MRLFKDYAKFYNLIYANRPYKQEAEFVYRWANRPKIILELGIGTGEHAKYWCNKVDRIVGIDNSQEMLDNAYQHPKIKYMCIPLHNLDLDTEFDCVFSLFNVMGYTLLEFSLGKIPIRRNGLFIFDTWDAEKFKKQLPQVRVKFYKDFYRVAIPELISKRIIRIDYIIVKLDKIVAFERHFVQGYFRKDIEQLCKLHKYKIIDTKPTKDWTVWHKLQKL